MEIGMVGLGNMGTAVANNIAGNGHNVTGWEYFVDVVGEINTKHRNSKYLKGIELSPKLRATVGLEEAVKDKELVFIALPSSFIKQALSPVAGKLAKGAVVVNLAKGIEETTCLTATGMLAELFTGHEVVALSGPSIANEFARGLPCGVVLAGKSRETLFRIAHAIETPRFRARFSSDVVGVEWSGILKNIYAIGLGIIHGSGFDSINFKAVYLTRALEEMADLVEAMGGERHTVHYLAGLGDLLATSLSEHSHNRRLGEMLSEGKNLEQAKQEMGILPEGIKVMRIAVYLSEKYHVAMPVAEGIHKSVDGGMSAKEFVDNFMLMGV